MQTLNRAAGVAIVLFFAGLGLMIGVRIEQVTIALLGGVLIALLVVIPATALVVVLIQRDRPTYTPHQVTPPAHYLPSPTYVAPSQAAKAYLPPQASNGYADEPFTMPKGRRVHIIGGTSSSSQLLDDPDTF